MIKDRLVNLINEYVGGFVENINHDNLNYSVLKGKVELTDLVLKPSALEDALTLQLGKEQAFEVKVGHLDYIRLSIPWGNLFGGTEVRLELDGLYILLSPVSMDTYNKERVEEIEQKLKQAMLKALDPSVIQKVSKEAEKHPGLFEKIGKYILNNIQIKISNVHVRYEDIVSNPGKPFAAGGILGGLYVFTTNDRWEEVELDSSAKILHKLGRISDFSLYWNSRVSSSDLVGDTGLVQSGGWKNLLKQSIRSKMISADKFSPVLTPFSAEAKVILYNIDDYKMPKIYIKLSVQDAEARMSRSQYVSATQWLEFSKRLDVNRRYRKFRPTSSVKSSVKSWWRYAYESVLEHNIRPYSWPRIVQYKQEYEKYWKLYKKYLESDKEVSIKQRLEEWEKSMDVTNILKARAQAKVQFAEETEEREKEKREEMRRKKEEKKNAGGGWFSWFWGGTEEEEALDDITAEEELFGLSEEEKREIYEGVGYQEAQNPQRMPKEYVAYKIQVEVQKISGCLTSTESPGSSCILQVIMDEMRTSYENRPGGEGIRVVSNTESFVISGVSLDNKQVKLLTSNGGIYTADLSGQMFFMEYELRPLHIKADQSLKMTVRPVEIFYDQHAIAEIFNFFQSSDHTQDTDMNALAMEKLSGVVKYSKDMLLYAIEQQSTFYVAIHMRSPYIVIPENGTLHNGGHVLVVDFGTLSVESQLQDKSEDLGSSLPSTVLQNQMYDIFQVKVTEVKALIADSAEEWPQYQTKSNSRFHVLPSTQLSVSFHKTIVPDNYQIPHQKFDVQLPSLTLTLNDKQILVLYNFLFHFPSPSLVPPKLETTRDTGEPTPHRMVLSDVQLDPDIATLRAIRKSILRRPVSRAHKTITEEGGVGGPGALPPIQSVAELMTSSEEDLEDEDRQWKSDTSVRSVEDYLTDRVKMKTYLRLQVAEMVLQISQGEGSESRDYLMFRLDRISADTALLNFVGDSGAPRQCGSAMFASVGALSLADKLHTGATGAYLELLRTESDKELITFSYRQINTDCPDFDSVFDSTENKATLVCNSLTIRLDQIGMCYFKKFLEDLQNSISEVEKRWAGPVLDSVDAPQVPPNVRRRSRDTSSITSQRISQLAHRISAFVDEVDAEMSNVVPKQKNLVKFHLTSKVQKVTIHLSNLDNPLAEVDFTEMDSQISVEKRKACVRSQIKDMSVLDKTTGTLYPHILMLEETDSPFFYMKVEQFWHRAKKTKIRRGGKKLDYNVELVIGDLQLAYVNRFLWDITKFFEPLKTPEFVEVATATMENVTKQVAEIQPSSVRVGLKINMRTPTIIMPKMSKSPDLLLFRFDSLQISNSIKTEYLADESTQEWNDISFKVKAMQISRAKVLNDGFVVCHNLAEPVNFLASVSLALEPVKSKVLYDVSGDLQLMKVNMFQSDLKLVMDVMSLNFQEGAPKPRKVTELSPHQSGDEEELTAPETTDTAPAPTTPYNAVLTFQGLVVQLFEEKQGQDGSVKPSVLSRVEIGKLVGRLNTQADGDIRTDVNLSLQTLSLDDTRPSSVIINKRIIDCVRETINEQEEELLPLISVIYKEKTDGNQEADIRMEKITVNIHIPYLQSLYQFFMQALEKDNPTTPTPRDSTSTEGGDVIDSPPPEPQPTGVFTLYGTIKQPEFILHGSAGVTDDRILVLGADIEFNMRNDSLEQKLGAKVKELKMYSSRMGIRTTSKQWVIEPCQVEMERRVSNNHAHHQVLLSDLEVYVSPQVIHLCYDVSKMLTSEEDLQEEDKDKKEKITLTNLWSIHKTSAKKWIEKIDPEKPTNPLVQRRAPSETLVATLEKINVYFRIRNLDHHVDLLHLFCSVETTIQDWSRQLHMKADVELKASYFNERLSVWEPLIEPVCETVGVYRPWWAVIKIVKGRSYPMAFNHVQENFNMEDCLRNDVQHLLHKSQRRSSTSESETDGSTEMTVLRPKLNGRASRLASERSHESLSHQASIQGESDTEPDGLIQSITNKLGGIFSDDDSSEDADISDTDDNDELFDPSLDKPVFLTPKGPMQAGRDQDEVDAPLLVSEQDTIEEAEPGEDVPQSYYFIMASQDQLLLNVTPQAINVLTDINKAMTKPESLEMDTLNLPALQIFNKLGVNASVTLHPDIKVHEENIGGCKLYKDGESPQPCDFDTVDSSEVNVKSETDEADGLISSILGRVGHMAVSAGAYVFDNDEDYLSGQQLSLNRFRLHVDGFHLSSTVSHRRACRQLMPLLPHKPEDGTEVKQLNKTKYWYLLDIDVWHGRKVINFLSPLQIKNNLGWSMEVFCKTKDLKVYQTVESDTEEFVKLVTLATGDVYDVPLFVAFHLPLFMAPSDSSYKMTSDGIWWKDFQGRDKSKVFSCPLAEADTEPFYFMVIWAEGSKLVPPQAVPAGVPYYQLTLSPPVILHNYLPYNIQYSLEKSGTRSAFVMLKMGDSCHLNNVNLKDSYKLHLQLQDYQSVDWTGVYEIIQSLEEFKAVSMSPYDFGFEGSNNKHLTLTVHATQQPTVDLYVYSPYWLINKTDLDIQVKGSKSEAVFDCPPNLTSPILFRFKKNRPKKAKIKVYNSRWSQSFSLDTVGNSGVVICNDKERKTKYRLMLQFNWSDLKLTRILTITPFFLVVNKTSRALRFMEENETTDLWMDISVGECKPYWPVTSSDKMFIRYSESSITSEHFPINSLHNTVLRMENGTAVCVEVTGGLETSRTISFTDYDIGDAPVEIENLCEDVFIVIRQKGQHQMTVLGQDQAILYTWDNPTGNRTLLWNVYNGKKSQESEIDITKDSYNPKRLTVKLVQSSSTYNYNDAVDGRVDSSPEDETDPGEEDEGGGDSVDGGLGLRSKLKTKAYKMTIYWVSFLDQQQRVVLFTQDPRVAEAARMMYEGEHVTWFSLISLDGISLSVINEAYEEVALVSLSSLPASWEIEVKNRWKMLEDITLVTWLEDKWKNGVDQASWDNRIEVDFRSMRMTKPYIGDLRRVAYPGLYFQHRISEHQTLFHARVYKIQIDNQLLDAYHQTVLSCVPTPAYLVKKKGPKPCIEFGMIRRVVPENNVDTFRQFQVIIQELRLAVDWGFIESIQDTFADLMPKEATESDKLQSDILVLQRPLEEVAEVMADKTPHRIFFEMLKISPVKVHVSFSLRGNPHLTHDVQPSMASDVKEFLRNSIGATFTEVKDIELRLGFFERRGVLLSSAQMQTQAVSHYRQQLMLQIYVVIFGLDVLGNPYGLIKDITEGLGELFYEPLLDTIQGEDAFSSNMIRGFQNAMGHIVGGTANSVARISGTLGNTLAYLSLDDEFQKRRARRIQQQPRNMPHSMAMAGKGFLSGMKFGLLGVVLDPIHGASEEGVEGFFKGIGKGLLGLITQPLGGVMDMVSMAFDGLRRSAENDVVAIRMRLPRFINPYNGLEPYSWYRAQGNFILTSLREEQRAPSIFVDFAPLSYDDRADLLFITDRTILCLSKNRFSPGYDVKWEVERERIMGIPEVTDTKLVFTLKDKKGSMFSGNIIEISSSSPEILKWVQERLERV